MKQYRLNLQTMRLSICGWSGSGKTWTLERLIPRFNQRNLSVCVVKHDAHALTLDSPHKDTGRLWDAGATRVIAHDAAQLFTRSVYQNQDNLIAAIEDASASADFILIEGHKNAPWPKLWLEHPANKDVPKNLTNVIEQIPYRDDRLERCEQAVMKWLGRQWKERRLNTGIAVGGRSLRMGVDKTQFVIHGERVIDRLAATAQSFSRKIVLLGNQNRVDQCDLPILPDVDDTKGPMAGMLSAMRWAPQDAWLFLACDMPLFDESALQWLVAQREPGVWAMIAKGNEGLHPLGAVYEPQMREVFERRACQGKYSIHGIADHPKTKIVEIPGELRDKWINCNTPDEWEKAKKLFSKT